MAKGHLDHILDQWPFDPEEVLVRLVQGKDGRDLLQMRIDMGVLQLETVGRPDGSLPHGHETYLDYLLDRVDKEGEDYQFSETECNSADREFVQFYHRRICWLRLRRFDLAADDAAHTLHLMDLCRDHSPDPQWTMSHEQYRPFVMFHRIQALAISQLDKDSPETAITEINQGLTDLHELFEQYEAEDHFDEDELVQRLVELRERLRDQFSVGQTLSEKLDDAIRNEHYELAAKLRDELKTKGKM
jgi:hypothetical protein